MCSIMIRAISSSWLSRYWSRLRIASQERARIEGQFSVKFHKSSRSDRDAGKLSTDMNKCLKTYLSVNECVTSGSVMFVVWRIGAPRGGRHCCKGSLGLEARNIFCSSRREYLASHVLY
jgi:hypothetical protein